MMRSSLSIIFLFFLASCDPSYWDWYKKSEPEKVRAFMEKYNILRQNCDGSINQEATIYALIDFSRLNFVHTSDVNKTEGASIMDLVRDGEERGYILIDGCPGTADFYEKTLGAVGIEAISDWIWINGQRHTRVDFPSLGKTSLHADELHKNRFSQPIAGFEDRDIPSQELLAPMNRLENPDGNTRRQFYEDLILTFRPQFDIFLRVKYGGYGKFFTDQELQDADSGKKPINQNWFTGVGATQTLRALDAEVDRLGGPEKAIMVLESAIKFQSNNKQLVPVSPYKIFMNECPPK